MRPKIVWDSRPSKPSRPYIMLHARRDIRQDSEIVLDYGDE